MASFKYNGKFARDVGLLMDQSKHLPDKIIRELFFHFMRYCCGFCVFIFVRIFFLFVLFFFFLSSVFLHAFLFICYCFFCLFVCLSAVVVFFSSFSIVLIILVYDTFYSKTSECINNAISIIQIENLNCKGLRQRGLITNQGNFKSGAGLWISHWHLFWVFYCIISCIVRLLTRDVVELQFNATYLIGCCKWILGVQTAQGGIATGIVGL